MMQWIAETLVATTLLMLLVLAVRPWVANRFGARAAYLLWFAPALRMILPPLPADWFGDRGAAMQDVVVVLAGTSSPSLQPATTAGGSAAWLIFSLSVWLGGAAFFFGRHWLNYIRFSRDVSEDGRPLFDAGRIPVTASANVSSPIALGVFGKSVIVPEDFEHRFDEEEQRLAVQHELTHHDRHDVPVNFAALAVLALHWWNPIAHIAHRAFRLDQEAACDAIVLEGASPQERHAYGSALFKSAMGRVPLAACAMGATTTLKARLRRILTGPAENRWAKPGAAFATMLVAAGVTVTASGGVPEVVEPVLGEAPRALVLGGGDLLMAGYEPQESKVVASGEECPPEPHKHVKTRTMALAAAKAARATAAEARAEALAASKEASAEAADAMTEAREARAEALRDAAQVRAEALREAQEARAEALRASGEARAEAWRAANEARAEAMRALSRVRADVTSMAAPAAGCSGQGTVHTVSFAGPNGEGRQAMRIVVCGKSAAEARLSVVTLRKAKSQIKVDPTIAPAVRVQMIAAIDKQIERAAPVPAVSPLPAVSIQ